MVRFSCAASVISELSPTVGGIVQQPANLIGVIPVDDFKASFGGPFLQYRALAVLYFVAVVWIIITNAV